ncbi:MAG TPA: methylamine utilization protein [Burkholderiales bacterium]|nr:methylamine utilization protein [Burkholderiales bacterium]
MRTTSAPHYLCVLLAIACGDAAAASVIATVADSGGAPVFEAVVYLLPTGANTAVAPRPGVMDQANKEFLPLVVPVQLGAAVSFPNKDNIRHHVYSFSPAKVFQLKLYSGTPSKPVIFDKPGVVVLGCNIHDWMVGYIYVFDTPYFVKTGKTGTARLDGLPAGEYELRIWHPHSKSEFRPRAIKLTESMTENAEFQLELSPPQSAPAKE